MLHLANETNIPFKLLVQRVRTAYPIDAIGSVQPARFSVLSVSHCVKSILAYMVNTRNSQLFALHELQSPNTPKEYCRTLLIRQS
jgi:hypothetical protein